MIREKFGIFLISTVGRARPVTREARALILNCCVRCLSPAPLTPFLCILNERFPWPFGCDVDIAPRRHPLEEEEEEIVDDDAETEQFACPYAAPVVPLESVDEGKVALNTAPCGAHACGIVELCLTDVPRDAVVHPLGALGDVGPRVHLLDLVVEPLGADLVRSDVGDGLDRGGDDVVFFRLGELGHVSRQDLWDTADLGAHDVEPTARGLDDDCPECFCQRWMQVDVPANHDVADLLVPHAAYHLDAVLEDILLDHLLEIDGLGPRAGDDEACVGLMIQDAWDGCYEEVYSLVVEEAGDDNNGDGVVGTKTMSRDRIVIAERAVCRTIA